VHLAGPALFRTLLGVKFYESPDVRASKLPLVDRLATLLVMPRTESLAVRCPLSVRPLVWSDRPTD